MKLTMGILFMFLITVMNGYAEVVDKLEEIDKDKVSFEIEYKGITTSLKIVPLFLSCGEIETVKIKDNSVEKYIISENEQEILLENNSFNAEIKNEKYKTIKITKVSSGETVLVNIFKKEIDAYKCNGFVNGYKVGIYPYIKDVNKKKYEFIEINQENRKMKISPNYTIEEFRSKPITEKFPVYIMLDEKIIHKVEGMIENYRREHIYIEKFVIMSAYRTPVHNNKLGNGKLSRHVFGDAVDIFVDENHDGKMDDINNDGVIDAKDIKMLYDIAAKMDDSEKYSMFSGGLSMYESNRIVGQFLHVDSRGSKIRW